MTQRGFRSSVLCWPLGLSLSLAVACSGNSTGDVGGGGSSGSGGSGVGPTGGTSMSSAGTSSASGSGSKAGSGNSGGTNSGGGGDFSTSVPGDKPLSDLTPDEVSQLCDDLDAYYSSSSVSSDLQEFSCRLSGVLSAAFSGADTDAAAQTACQMAYDACQAEPGTTTSQCGAPEGTCTATVAELEACTNDTSAYLKMATDSFPACSELTLADLEAGPGGEELMDPASCTAFEMKCPGGPLPPTSAM